MNIEFNLTQKEVKGFSEFFSFADIHEAKKLLIDKAIEQYKELRDRKNNLHSSNTTHQNTLDELRSKISSSKDLFRIKDRIELELKKFGQMGEDVELPKRVNEMKQKRLSGVNQLLQSLKNITSNLLNQSNNTISFKESGNVRAKFLFIPAFLSLLTGVALYVLSSDFTILLFGILVSIVNIISFFLINMYQEIRFEKSDLFLINYNDSIGNYYQKFVEKLNRQENAFFVNAAWVNALREEKDKVMGAIQSRLGGRSFYDIDTEIKNVSELIEKQNIEINTIIDSMINAEEYLKLRREADLLKTESNSEFKPTDEINITIKGIDRLEQKLKGTIINYLNYLKKNEIIKSISYL